MSALAILQSTASANSDQVSIIQISLSIGVVLAFIGGILILGSKFIPNALDKVGKTNDYALLLIVILGLEFGLSFTAKSLGLSVVIGLPSRSSSCRIQNGSNSKSHYHTIEGRIFGIVFHIHRCTNEHISSTLIHWTSHRAYSVLICLKATYSNRNSSAQEVR